MRDKGLKIVVVVGIICIISILLLVNINKFIGNRKEVVGSNTIKGDFKQAVTIGSELLTEANGKIICYSKDGVRKWSLDLGLKNPKLIKTNNDFVAADINGSVFKVFSSMGLKYERSVKGTILNVKANKKGRLAVIYKDENNKSRLNFYDNKGNLIFSPSFYKGALLDAGISDDNSKYFSVVQDVNGEDIMYQITNYDSHGNQDNVNMIKGEVYMAGHYVGDNLIFCDTSQIHCVNKGNEVWKKHIDGSISRIFDTNDYFIYESVPKGTVLSSKYNMNVIDSNGNVKLNKSVDDYINSVQIFEKGMIVSGERDLKYMGFNGKEIWDYPTYKDIKVSAFDGDNGYVLFVKDALYVKLGAK